MWWPIGQLDLSKIVGTGANVFWARSVFFKECESSEDEGGGLLDQTERLCDNSVLVYGGGGTVIDGSGFVGMFHKNDAAWIF
jgi:hypothetical protein